MHLRILPVFILIHAVSLSVAADSVVDSIEWGDAQSEQVHELEAASSEVYEGALGVPARRLLVPSNGEGWRGGSLTFNMAVDPNRPNYFTAKFWGGDVTGEESRLMLFIDGKQVGQRHLGEIEQLDIMTDEPRYTGRFFYKTFPLPEAMTRGKRGVEFTIEAQGPIHGYAGKIEQYQKNMTEPSRGLYRVYVHTDPFFAPDPSEPQGETITDYPVSDREPPITLKQLQSIINDKTKQLLEGKDHIGVDDIHFLAIVYHSPWSAAYQKRKVVEKVAKALDQTYLAHLKRSDDNSLGVRWIGYGPAGEAVHMLAEELGPLLKARVTGTKVSRRKAWALMFKDSRDFHSQRRRLYTNQSMILDTNLYRCNSALKAIAPKLAWPEKHALRLLHESIGLKPWSGSLDERGKPSWSRGKKYYLLTDQALTKELGYVGEYGESVFDLALHIYNATRPRPGAPGDPAIKDQMVKLSHARAVFRYPMDDKYGHRAMRLEAVIGWRDWKFPGKVCYDQRPGRDGGPLDVAVGSMDPELLGYAFQMVEDKQVFPALAKRAEDRRGKSLLALAVSISAYEKLMKIEPSPHRLPMTPGQPDFVFADPEIGVVAVKNGDEILYASLYWRARYAINNLARVHHLTPQLQRDATVNIHTRFRDSGHVYTMPDQSNEPFNTRHEKFYKGEGMFLATAGQKQPIAKVPADQTDWKLGRENAYAGKGDFYRMEYGPYLVAMNCTRNRSFDLDLPEVFLGAKELTSGEAVTSSEVKVEPGETLVFYRHEPAAD